VAETGLRFSAGKGGTSGQGSQGLRGGSWNNNENNARVSIRNNNHPDNRNNNIGFRVVVFHSFALHTSLRAAKRRSNLPFLSKTRNNIYSVDRENVVTTSVVRLKSD
jgi:hypothetical protein